MGVWNGIARPTERRAHARAWVELFPTRRFPGWLALVWAVMPGKQTQVYQVYVGRDRAAVCEEAERYAEVVRARGVEEV